MNIERNLHKNATAKMKIPTLKARKSKKGRKSSIMNLSKDLYPVLMIGILLISKCLLNRLRTKRITSVGLIIKYMVALNKETLSSPRDILHHEANKFR